MEESQKYQASIRTAKKLYRCGTLVRSCAVLIQPGDNYFSLTLRRKDSFVSRKYCLSCGTLDHPKLIESALASMKRETNIKKARRSIRDVKFTAMQSRKFRNKPTASEEYLWSFLRNGAMGAIFQRQKALYGFVLDFYCDARKLAVELDGGSHSMRKEKDRERDRILMAHGIFILRFPASVIFTDTNYILDQIRSFIRNSPEQ